MDFFAKNIRENIRENISIKLSGKYSKKLLLDFFFLFKIIYNWKTYFIKYKLQINKKEKKKLLPPT